MRLLGRLNWWAPRPLAALYRQLGLAETAEAGESGLAEASVLPAKSLTEANL